MSLDVYLYNRDDEEDQLYWRNITHNLGKMAIEAGIYYHLWRPETLEITRACDLIKPLTAGLERLIEYPDKFKKFNPENGWGDYEGLLDFARGYLSACKEYPDAVINISR